MDEPVFFDWLQIQRAKKGLLVHVLAAKVGVTTRTIIAWEQGENKPRVNHIGKLAAALGVSIGEVMERVGR